MFKAILLGLIIATAPCQYPRDVIVTECNGGLVSVVDDNGDKWQFWGNDISPGSRITVVFDNNGTTNPYDDAIVKVLK